MVKFTNKIDLDKLFKHSEKAIESSLDEQAELLTKLSQKEVPKKDRVLVKSVETAKIGENSRRVSYDGPYAAYQHEGKRKDGSHVVRRYTTPGTKKFYIKDPLNKNAGKWASIIVKNFKNQGF